MKIEIKKTMSFGARGGRKKKIEPVIEPNESNGI